MIAIIAAVFVLLHPHEDCWLQDRLDKVMQTDRGAVIVSELYNPGGFPGYPATDIMLTYDFQTDHGVIPISRLVPAEIKQGHRLIVFVPLGIDKVAHLPGPLVSVEVYCQ